MIDGFGLYRPRRTPLHRSRAGFKVALLIIVGIGIALTHGPVWTLAWYVGGFAALASTLPPIRPTLRGLAAPVLIAAVLGAYQWWAGDRATAVEVTADFVAIAASAIAITTSTPLDEAMGLIVKLARPFRRHVPPETLGLMFALTIRAIPEVTNIMESTSEAARARGLERNARAWLTPVAVRTFGWALAVGDAITARGLAEQDRGPSPREPIGLGASA